MTAWRVCASSLPEHEQVYFVGFAARHGKLRKSNTHFLLRAAQRSNKNFRKNEQKKKKKKTQKASYF